MTTHQANLESRHAALLAAAECADNSAADLLGIAAALRQHADKLRTLQPPAPVAPTKTPPYANPRPH